MKTIDIHGKAYVTVNERLKEFRASYPKYSLRSELVTVNEKMALIKAVIADENGSILAEGTAFEQFGDSNINKTSHVENCETSAWGRALGNFGIGIDASVATADEVANALLQKEQKETLSKNIEDSIGLDQTQGSSYGIPCVDCKNAIEEDRIQYCKEKGFKSPTRCYECNRKYKMANPYKPKQ